MIHLKSTYDMESGRLLHFVADVKDYSGPWALAKGDKTAKEAEKQQLAFSKQLMDIFGKQFQHQMEIFNFLKGKLEPMIDHPTGYSPEALAAMRTSATENITQQTDNAQRALQTQQFALGGRDLPSGVNEMQFGALKGLEAGKIADTQNQITLADENLKQQNYWNAMNALNGQQALLNPLGYAGAANQGFGNVANLSQAYTQSQGPGIAGILGGVVGGAFSGAGQAGGFGKLFCWVAAELYDGWGDQRTDKVRIFIGYKAMREWGWALFALAYIVLGRPAAWLVRHSKRARRVAHRVFDPILEEACNAENWKR